MGFHPSYKYREVHELTLENGVVVKSEDLSAQMAAIRANLDEDGRPRRLIPPEPRAG